MFEYLNHPQVKFVGEIGLDYYWDTTFMEEQKARFIHQIDVANQHNLPIIIHVRESMEDVYTILKEHPVNRAGIVHCFTGDVASAKKFIDLGYYIGVGGIVTFKNGEAIRDLVHHLPFDRILSETDSPYLAPVPKRGKRNEPAYVSYVGKEIARLKELTDEDVQIAIQTNYERLTQ